MNDACPICQTVVTAPPAAVAYRHCPACGLGFRPDDRGARAGREPLAASMTGHDREVNRDLARWLVAQALRSTPGRTLDLCCRYPFLVRCLADLGCEAIGADPDPSCVALGRDLGVDVVAQDLDAPDLPALYGRGRGGRYALVTLVHAFDRVRDPVAAFRSLRRLVADDGRVFLRLPDHAVAGSERWLAPGHGVVAPLLFSFSALLELCVRTGDQFAIEATWSRPGAGERDVLLVPLARKPRVIAGLIVKNEERDLPRCLRSIEPVVDEVVVVDTGSTDRTLEVAASTLDKHVHVQTYTGASRQDASGDWKLWDFGKARNVFVDAIEVRDADWVLWMDADDELVTPVHLKRALWWYEHDVYGVQIESGGQRWVHHRLWRAQRGIRFEGRIHEYPTIGGRRAQVLADSVIRHDATPGSGEGANARNLRILLEEIAQAPTPRAMFYLGSTHKDASRWREAIDAYAARIAMGEHFRDEWLFAYLYKGRCERMAGDPAAAERTLLAAVAQERGWSEFWTELAYIAYDAGRWRSSIGYALQAVDAPIPPTQLWREPDKYGAEPARIASLCHERLGERAAALEWALRARERGHASADRDARIAALRSAT